MSDSEKIKCGDTVFHRPTKENWIVCYADYVTGKISWFGWPEGYAEIIDCELKESCSPEDHIKEIQRWIGKPFRRDDGTTDHRVGTVERLYGSILTELRGALKEGLTKGNMKFTRGEPIPARPSSPPPPMEVTK